MWIRSQDKEKLVKCDCFDIACHGEVYEIYSNYRMQYDNEIYDTLGFYSTMQKAIKVLDKIVAQMELCTETKIQIKSYSKGSDWDTCERVATVIFQMPQDDEV